ncbi:MAG TPA: helix-turn-helix domain-containing protein [Parvibaculum sp.]|jgi:AcrR family transcriptional regulator
MATQAERRDATIGAILEAARHLFAAHGFAATSIDDIAARAGVKKGAVYHHFNAKEEIFARIFEELSAELAELIPPAAQNASDILDAVGRGTLKYLTAIAGPTFRQILLIDGPAVLGWQAWRDVDARHFGGMIRVPLDLSLAGRATKREIDAIAQLIAGAVTEAALVCATEENSRQHARDLTSALQTMLKPFFTPV